MDCFNAILNSNRRFDKIYVANVAFDMVKQVCEKFGPDIKELENDSCYGDLQASDYFKLLKLTPNLEKIRFRPEGKCLKLSKNGKMIELNNLKRISCRGIWANTNFLTHIAPCGIEEFYSSGSSFRDGLLPNPRGRISDPMYGLTTFLSNQRNIKKLQLANLIPLESQKLTHFKFVGEQATDNDLELTLRSQPQLVAIEVNTKIPVTDRFVHFISDNMKSLEIIKINSSELSAEAFARFALFRQLKELSLTDIEENDLSILGNETVERLEISIKETQIPVANRTRSRAIDNPQPGYIYKIGTNFPNIKVLNMSMNKRELTVKLKDCVNAFKHLEILRFFNLSTETFFNFDYFHNDDSEVYPNLKMLQLDFDYNREKSTFPGAELMKIMKALPNLVNLSVDLPFNFDFNIFEKINESYPKLLFFEVEEVQLSKTMKIDDKFFASLQNFCHRLEHFEFDFKAETSERIAEALENFDKVETWNFGNDEFSTRKTITELNDQNIMEPFDYDKNISHLKTYWKL